MKIKKFFWDYLYFTRVERNGIVLLLALSLVALFLPTIYGFFLKKTPEIRTPLPDHDAFCAAQSMEKSTTETFHNAQNATLFYFDPNTADATDLATLGLPERTIKSILNYRSKGGKFRQPNDLSKIYTLSETDFLRLKPWISIGGTPPNLDGKMAYNQAQAPSHRPLELQPFNPNTADASTLAGLGLPEKTISGWLNYRAKGGVFRAKEDLQRLYNLSPYDYQRIYPFIDLSEQKTSALAAASLSGGKAIPAGRKYSIEAVDINRAEIADLVQLPGIGEGWAKRILNWREKLGGFSQLDQIAETRSLPDSVFQKVKPFLTVNEQVFKKIPLNTATWEDLNEHPYIDAKQARWIIAYREQHGKYQHINDLLQILEIKKDWLEKVRPYLAV